jgi:hypothetical protein
LYCTAEERPTSDNTATETNKGNVLIAKRPGRGKRSGNGTVP